MHKFISITNYFIILFLLFSACKVLENRDYIPFALSDASYYSWFAEGNESGTNIQIKLINVDPEVEFDSIIFRNVMVPVYTSEEGNELILNSVVPGGSSKISIQKDRIEKSDRLIFKFRGRKREFLLNKIRREKMRYYL